MVVPLHDNLFVRKMPDNVTASGILIADSVAKEKPMRGKVVMVSDSIKDSVNIGDEVLFSKFGPVEVEIDEEEFLVLNIHDILAKIITE